MSRTRKYLFGPIIVLSMIVSLAFSVFNVNAVDAVIDLSTNGSNDVVNGAYWENLVPHTTATGTGTFHSFLRVQNDGSEKGYNHGLKQNVFDEKESFTDPMLLSDVPTISFEGASYREFQLDVNENDAYLSLDRFQVYLTNSPNNLTYTYSTYSFGSNALKIYDTVGYVLKLGANGGSGKREYRVLIPNNLFVAGYTHVVLFTEHGLMFDTSDGFEEWGVEKQAEAIPTIEVIKTALTLSLPEPGDWVTYKVDILNTSDSTDPITINSLTDMIDAGAPYSISGSIFNNQALTDATTFPFTILPGMTKTVYFKSLVSGEPRTVHDVVTASGVDDENIPVSAFDDADVIITDVLPVITVNKSVVPPTLAEPGGIFHYSFSVTNNSVEPVHLTKITDLLPNGSTVIIYEWLSGATKIWLNPGETSQVFTSDITYSEFGTYTNTAWGYALDNEGNEAKDDDTETVNVTDVLPTIQLIKTASPSSRLEPGGLFTYTFTVKNLSVEPVMLTKVVDDKLGTLYEWEAGDPEIWIAVGGEYLLPGSFTKTYTDAGVYPNKGEAWAKDNEANTAYDDDSRSVTVTDVLPIITVNKSVTPPTLPEPGGIFHYSFSVTNNSVEPVHLTKIIDMLPNGTTAIIYEWLSGDPEIWLNPGETSKVFTSDMTYSEYGTYTNTAWGYALDNEGNEAKDDDAETVYVTDVLPDISVTKTANKTSIPFSGADVIFTFVIRNNSVENVEIFYINDSVFGDLLPEALAQFGGSPITIAPASTFTFTITRWVEGEAGGTHYDVVTTKGRDNENNEDTATDDETIRFYWYGFTPGYWKNHPEQWPIHTLFATTQTVRSVFNVDSRYFNGGKLDMNKDGKEDTLMDALNYKGGNDLKGKAQILLRAAVAALLNESALGDYFPPYDSIDELKVAVNAALATGNKTTIGLLASRLDYWNNGLHEFPD